MKPPTRSKVVPYEPTPVFSGKVKWGMSVEPSRRSHMKIWTHGRGGYGFQFTRRRDGESTTVLTFGMTKRGMLGLNMLLNQDYVVKDLMRELERAKQERMRKKA